MSAQPLTTLPALQTVPIPEKTTQSPKTSRVQKTCPCGVCGRDTAVNRDGRFRAHGPQEDRCAGTGTPVSAHVYPLSTDGKEVTVYGTCGVCGITDDSLHEVDSPKVFTRAHNHNRPRIAQEGDAYVVTWFRYRSFEWRRRYFDWHEDALDFANNLKEHTR